jgi:rhomboid protease GluP
VSAPRPPDAGSRDEPRDQPAGPPLLITDDMLARPAGRPQAPVDFERGMSYAPPVTLLLIAANIAVFVWEVGRGALTSRAGIIAAGALSRPQVLHGEWWRLVTPMFLHGSPEHLIGNMLALYVLGMACEHAVGSRPMLWLYLLSGVTGSLLSVALSPGPSVGASGAIFGLMGAVIAVLTRHQQRFYLRDKRIAAVLAAWAGYTIFTGLLSPYVDNAAHAGGFLGGALLGLRLEPKANGATR